MARMTPPQANVMIETSQMDGERCTKTARPKDGQIHLIFLSFTTPVVPSSVMIAAMPRRVEPLFMPQGRPFAEPAFK